jgi:hypothetical protein
VRSRTCSGGAARAAGHLFLCPACRADARLSAAFRRFPSPAALEAVQLRPVSEDFLRRVTASVAEDRRRGSRRRTLLSLAAALLFFLLAGAGHEARTSDTLRIEDAAQVLAPSALESLLAD